MNFILMLAIMMSCAKQSLIKSAKINISEGVKCFNILKSRMRNAKCEKFEVEQREYSVIMRCHKDDEKRGKFWDNYIFRISSSKLQIKEEYLPEIEKHTICIDDDMRIEAYEPKGDK